MEWMIHELAARAGITSRTLRHYDSIGLLAPSRVGGNGYRYYGPATVVRLQRILLLRRLGMGLPAIAEVLAEEVDEQEGLRAHIAVLEGERDRIEQQLQSARRTLAAVRAGAEPGADVILEGFNDRYKDGVISRWGEHAYQASNDWWHAKSLEQQRAWKHDRDDLVASWIDTWRAGVSPSSPRAQSLAARHVKWLSEIPGTPTAEGHRERSIQMVQGLGDTYVNDPHFATTYHSVDAAMFVRDALYEFARTRM